MSKEKTISKTVYLLEPKSPLVFRTGRPFDQAGDPASLEFPLPSTLAGACRAALGDAEGWDFTEKGQDLRKIPVHGPLAALIAEDGVAQPLFPKPADAVYMRKDKKEDGSKEDEVKTEILQLQPEDTAETDAWSDLPEGLRPVYPEKELAGKPYTKGARWWDEQNLTDWLLGKGIAAGKQPEELGWSGPKQELRTHVQLKSETLSAATGQLFQTSNLSFAQTRINPDEHDGWCRQRYGLLVKLPQDNLKENAGLFQRIGGEGRIARIDRQKQSWPLIHNELRKTLRQSQFIRLILATPALFTPGWRPGWLDEKTLTGSPPGFSEKETKHPITLQLRAFVSPRWEPVSGWDLQKISKGKLLPFGCARAVRRMVPAGAVYWFKVLAGKQALPELWLQPVSDLEQDQKDGYGLVLPGIWKRQENA